MARITFAGAAGTVTGSRYLVETDHARILVDCGLFQGIKSLRERNWQPPPFSPASLDAVILTHAHIDHTGYLPKLCKDGFRGRVFCTSGTRDLLQVLLPDSGYLQEEQARLASKWGLAKHRPAVPLYTREDAERCLSQLEPVEFHEELLPATGISASFTRAGHILGSGCLRLRLGETSVTFTGDVGRQNDPIMRPPEKIEPTDYLVMESTYGDRRHPDEDLAEALAKLVRETVDRGGTMLVPAFAVGRAQHLLFLLSELQAAGKIPKVPTFLDSPMAIDATKIFCKHVEDHRVSEAQCHALCRLPEYTRTPEQSKAIDQRSGPMIVISASGMATGGRILHHLRRFLPDERTLVLVVGYQSTGTRGRALVDGAAELKIHGQYVPVRARVAQISGLSAHADYAEMLDWLAASELSPRGVFVTHGEPGAADAMRRRVRERFGWSVEVPSDGSMYDVA